MDTKQLENKKFQPCDKVAECWNTAMSEAVYIKSTLAPYESPLSDLSCSGKGTNDYINLSCTPLNQVYLLKQKVLPLSEENAGKPMICKYIQGLDIVLVSCDAELVLWKISENKGDFVKFMGNERIKDVVHMVPTEGSLTQHAKHFAMLTERRVVILALADSDSNHLKEDFSVIIPDALAIISNDTGRILISTQCGQIAEIIYDDRKRPWFGSSIQYLCPQQPIKSDPDPLIIIELDIDQRYLLGLTGTGNVKIFDINDSVVALIGCITQEEIFHKAAQLFLGDSLLADHIVGIKCLDLDNPSLLNFVVVSKAAIRFFLRADEAGDKSLSVALAQVRLPPTYQNNQERHHLVSLLSSAEELCLASTGVNQCKVMYGTLNTYDSNFSELVSELTVPHDCQALAIIPKKYETQSSVSNQVFNSQGLIIVVGGNGAVSILKTVGLTGMVKATLLVTTSAQDKVKTMSHLMSFTCAKTIYAILLMFICTETEDISSYARDMYIKLAYDINFSATLGSVYKLIGVMLHQFLNEKSTLSLTQHQHWQKIILKNLHKTITSDALKLFSGIYNFVNSTFLNRPDEERYIEPIKSFLMHTIKILRFLDVVLQEKYAAEIPVDYLIPKDAIVGSIFSRKEHPVLEKIFLLVLHTTVKDDNSMKDMTSNACLMIYPKWCQLMDTTKAFMLIQEAIKKGPLCPESPTQEQLTTAAMELWLKVSPKFDLGKAVSQLKMMGNFASIIPLFDKVVSDLQVLEQKQILAPDDMARTAAFRSKVYKDYSQLLEDTYCSQKPECVRVLTFATMAAKDFGLKSALYNWLLSKEVYKEVLADYFEIPDGITFHLLSVMQDDTVSCEMHMTAVKMSTWLHIKAKKPLEGCLFLRDAATLDGPHLKIEQRCSLLKEALVLLKEHGHNKEKSAIEAELEVMFKRASLQIEVKNEVARRNAQLSPICRQNLDFRLESLENLFFEIAQPNQLHESQLFIIQCYVEFNGQEECIRNIWKKILNDNRPNLLEQVESLGSRLDSSLFPMDLVIKTLEAPARNMEKGKLMKLLVATSGPVETYWQYLFVLEDYGLVRTLTDSVVKSIIAFFGNYPYLGKEDGTVYTVAKRLIDRCKSHLLACPNPDLSIELAKIKTNLNM